MEKTIDKDYTEEVDYNSFIEESENTYVNNTGEVRLKSVETVKDPPPIVKADLMERDLFKIKTFSDNNLYITKDKTSKQWDVIEAWTGERDIDKIAGKKVPVKLLDDNYYRIPEFIIDMDNKNVNDILNKLSINYDSNNGLSANKAKELYNNNYIKYVQGNWVIDKALIHLYNMRENLNQDKNKILNIMIYPVLLSLFIESFMLILSPLLFSYFVLILIGNYLDSISINQKDKYLSYMYGRQEYNNNDVYL